MVLPQESSRSRPNLEKQVRLQVRFSGGPAGWALAYGGLLERHPALRLLSLRIVSSDHAEFIILSHTPAGLAATLLELEGLPAESIEVRGDSLFASIPGDRTLPETPPLPLAPAERVALTTPPSPASSQLTAPARHGHLSLVQDPGDDGEPLQVPGVDHLGVAVGPFRRFSQVNRFIDTLGSVQDVRSVKPRRFRRGTLYALVDYVGVAPFTTVLASMHSFPLRITGTTEDRIEAVLLEPEDQQLRAIA